MNNQNVKPIELRSQSAKSFLARLKSDVGGNIIALTAAAVVPMVGVVGGAVDMSRAYMTKARLQSACDAGVLAGRRAMTDLNYTTAARARANKMFAFNYRDATSQATGTSFNTSGTSNGQVNGTATTVIPTVLMRVFGKMTLDFTVTCSADLQVPNIDTMLVLDVTGSMQECPDGSGNCNAVGSGSKIEGLRSAVRSFYNTLQTAAATSPTAQIRYGFVPYSQAVNASDIFRSSPGSGQLPLTQLVNNWSVQSRVANFNTAETTVVQAGTPTTSTESYTKPAGSPGPAPTGPTPMSYNDCTDYKGNSNFSIDLGPDSVTYSNPSPAGRTIYRVVATNTLQSSAPGGGAAYDKLEYNDGALPLGDYPYGNAHRIDNFKTCSRSVVTTQFRPNVIYRFSSWTYKPVSFDVSQFKAGNTVNYVSAINSSTAYSSTSASYDPVQMAQLPVKSGLTVSGSTWRGCVEERSTVAVSNFSPIPADAEDLDYLNLGTNDATFWRPVFSDLAHMRSGVAEETDTNVNRDWRPSVVCPAAPMRNLNTMTLAQIDAYTPLLTPGGNTYHDIGMVWGLRMLNPNGMFSSRNLTGTNGGQISRNLIFMTDGILVPNTSAFSAYGIEQMDKRITGSLSTPDITTLHARRFQALCDAARAQGISVWVIAFGLTITSNLTACADPGRAYTASNSADLAERFKQIALDIADLRLTQ
jgi:Flp pilus assembly protein TadG